MSPKGSQGGVGRLAVIYTRVSTSEQADEGRSLPAQLTECRQYVARQPGWTIDSEWQDVMSGTRDDRPQYQEMLARVRELRAQGQRVVMVVAWLHRLGRRVRARVEAWEECKALGVEIHSALEGGQQNELVFNVLAAVAQEEVKQLGDRVSTTWNNLNRAGWFKVSPAMPWGYAARTATDDERRAGAPRSVLVEDETTAPLVRELFQRVASGQPTTAVARWAGSLGPEQRGSWSGPKRQTGRRGKRGAQVVVPLKPRGPERALAQRSVHVILRNPLYAGLVAFNSGSRAEPDIQWIEGKHAPLVDRTTWDEVQRRLDANAERPRALPQKFMLTGFLKCPQCSDGMMRGDTVAQGRRYRCTGRMHGAGAVWCNATVDAESVEKAALAELGKLLDALADPDVQAGMRARWAELQRPSPIERLYEKQRQDLEIEIEALRAERRNATRLLARDEITKADYDDLIADSTAQQAEKERELAALGPQQTAPAFLLPPVDEVLSLYTSWTDVLAGSDMVEQRDVLRVLVHQVIAPPPGRPPRGRRDYSKTRVEWTPLGEALTAVQTDGGELKPSGKGDGAIARTAR